MDWQALFLSGDGRIGRRDFWIAALILFVLWAIGPAFHVLAPLIWLALLYPGICIFAKRLHDFGRSGWLILAPVAVAAACMVLGVMFGGLAMLGSAFGFAFGSLAAWPMMWSGLGVMMAFMGVAALVKFVFVLWVGLTPGEPGPNRYGPPAADYIVPAGR